MKFRAFALALALTMPVEGRAEPILVGGLWAPATTPAFVDATLQPLEPIPFWSGVSWDGWNMGVGHLLDDYTGTRLEYLNDGSGGFTPFRFEEDIFNLSKIGGITAWTNGVISRREDGAFTYNSGTGRISNSWDNPEQDALFRLVTPEVTHYFLGIEDIILRETWTDGLNNYVLKFDTHSVPEPGTLLLLGSGLMALAARRKLAARKARRESTV